MISSIKPVILSSAIVAALFTGVFVYLRSKKRKRDNKIPTEWKKLGTVKKLYIFPLKSGHYIEIEEGECTQVGLRLVKTPKNPLQLRDRSFIAYGEKDHEIRSGRVLPNLVKIEVAVHDENHISLDAPQMRTLYVKIPERTDNNVTHVTIWSGEKIEAIDCGDEAARWLSQHLAQRDSGYRLGYHDAFKRRDLVRHQDRMKFYNLMTDSATGLFSDVTSVMMMNQASVDDYLQRTPSANVTALNFRGNIIIEDPEIKPYDEDKWNWIKVGDEVIMRNVKECTRCVFTTINPETGQRNSDREPLTTLSTYRVSKAEKTPIMGIHMDVKKTGIIKRGDTIYIGCE